MKSYDVYLTSALPDSSLVNQAKRFDPVVKMCSDKILSGKSGYLGLSISLTKAIWLSRMFTQLGIRAYIVPPEYQTGKLSASQARVIAEDRLKDQAQQFQGYDFGEITEVNDQFGPQDLMTYCFAAISDRMQREGKTPGGLFVYIDRVDGHIWDSEELLESELLHELTKTYMK